MTAVDTIDTLADFITAIDRIGELRRISAPVKVDLELCEIADRVMKQPNGGAALLFEHLQAETGAAGRHALTSPESVWDAIRAFFSRRAEVEV